MIAQVFQHVPFEGPGSIGPWLQKNHYQTSTTHFYLGESPPALEDLDLLIVMGGPMSVNDVQTYPWLETEKSFIRTAIDSGIPVLGICLGAQLIASALGAKVYPNSTKEIGWFPIFGNQNSRGFRLAEELMAFHWHGETFDLPPGSELLASTPECTHQAFELIHQKVVGLQFHLETTAESLDAIIQNCRNELISAPKIMREQEMRRMAHTFLSSANVWMDNLLTYMTSGI